MIHDITATISPTLAVWPGTAPFSSELIKDLVRGDPQNRAKMQFSSHIGTHVDAPYHFDDSGEKVDELSLDAFVGPARVVTVDKLGELKPSDLATDSALIGIKRIIFHTPVSEMPTDEWPGRIAYIGEGMAKYLTQFELALVGLDSPSIDPLDSKELRAHRVLAQHGIAILEGLCLRGVPDGDYELFALPLKIANVEASPVRAILRTLDDK